MANTFRRKSACKKCGGWENYKCRTCVGCAKNKSKQQYTERLGLQGKARDTQRLVAANNNEKVYISKSTCKTCDSNTKYTSSGSCTKCHSRRSQEYWSNYKDIRASAIPSFVEKPTRQLIFNSMMDYQGNKLMWYRDALRAYPEQSELIEYVHQRGQQDLELVKSYEDHKELLDFTNFKQFKMYEQRMRQYDVAPNNIQVRYNLLIAEFALHNMSEFHSHSSFPSKYFEFDPATMDSEYMWSLQLHTFKKHAR